MKELLKDRNKVLQFRSGREDFQMEDDNLGKVPVGFLKVRMVDKKEKGIEGRGDSLICVLGMG